MLIEYLGAKEINGSLIVLDNIEDVAYEEMCDIVLADGTARQGRVIQIDGKRVVIEVFEGTRSLSLHNMKTRMKGHPMQLPLSMEILGRTFSGAGVPIDGLGEIFADKICDINGLPINPIAREYPRDYIATGISSIDVMSTLIRGQKLPIFTGAGMKHNELAAQIVRQAHLQGVEDDSFAVVFASMGISADVAEYFKSTFAKAGVLSRVVMFLNLSSDPVIERILTPRCALTAAEYLAYELGMHILVIMTDMTSYAEAVREFSSSKGEIPGRKGYPGYLYSDLASIYERAGIVKGKKGSVTQLPILTMPNDDITHPVPDLTGYITEGQIVLDRALSAKGVYPPVAVLPSLSRLMKDCIGDGYTREDHSELANQLFSMYAKVVDARALSSVIGEEELSDKDKNYLKFGKRFEDEFISQGFDENRSIEDSLDLGWELLSVFDEGELDRIKKDTLKKYHRKHN